MTSYGWIGDTVAKEKAVHDKVFYPGVLWPTDTTGAAFIVQGWNVKSSKRSCDFLNVLTVELYAMLMAVQWAALISNHKGLVCSDSVSCQ